MCRAWLPDMMQIAAANGIVKSKAKISLLLLLANRLNLYRKSRCVRYLHNVTGTEPPREGPRLISSNLDCFQSPGWPGERDGLTVGAYGFDSYRRCDLLSD